MVIISLYLLNAQVAQGQVSVSANGAGIPSAVPLTGTGGTCDVNTITTSAAAINVTALSTAKVKAVDDSAFPIYSIDTLTLDITHAYNEDLDISLIAPDRSTSWDLSSDNGASGDNYTNVIFLDGGGILPTTSTSISGTFQAEAGPFTTGFTDQALIGDWTLSICDDFNADNGTLNTYGISFIPINDTCGSFLPAGL